MLSRFEVSKFLRVQWRDPRALDLLFITIVTSAVRIPFTIATADDAYITFRYARNLANGLGFVYNAEERVLGTTTPLFTLLLALVSRLGFDLVLIAKATNLIAEAATAILIYIILHKIETRGMAWTGAILFVISQNNVYWSASGLETGLYTFLILFTLYLYSNDRWIAMGWVAALLTLLRPDGWLAVGAITIAWLFKSRKFTLLKPLLILIAINALWFLFALWYFGSIIPNSIIAKAVSYRAAGVLDWMYTLLTVYIDQGGFIQDVIVVSLIILGFVSIFIQNDRRRYIALPIWFVLYCGVFTIMRAGPFDWYFSPLFPVLFLFVTLGISDLLDKILATPAIASRLTQAGKYVLASVLMVVVLARPAISLYRYWTTIQKQGGSELPAARSIGIWLNENTLADATVALESIGEVGWYSNRYILDEGGLVSQKVLAINTYTPGKINSLGILQAFQPDYYIAWQHWELEPCFSDADSRSWLMDNYVEINRYDIRGYTWVMFKRRN